MRLEIELGGFKHIQDLPPDWDTMHPIVVKLTILDETRWTPVFETQRVVYIRDKEVKVS